MWALNVKGGEVSESVSGGRDVTLGPSLRKIIWVGEEGEQEREQEKRDGAGREEKDRHRFISGLQLGTGENLPEQWSPSLHSWLLPQLLCDWRCPFLSRPETSHKLGGIPRAFPGQSHLGKFYILGLHLRFYPMSGSGMKSPCTKPLDQLPKSLCGSDILGWPSHPGLPKRSLL